MTNFNGHPRRYGWLIVLPLFFVIYATSFNRYEILEKKHSVLAEADTAAFDVLIKDFDPAKKYGDEYRLGDRQLGDVAQKHKIHHTLYFYVAGALGRVLTPLNEAIGVSPKQMLYTINALLSCVNIGLLYLLMGSLSPSGRNPLPFVVLYGVSLSTWIYSSVTESWILSVTLLLVFLLAYARRKDSFLVLSVIVGVAMTNNIWLCTLFTFILAQLAATSPRMTDFLKKAVGGGVLALATWALTMSLFAIGDSSIGPLEYVRYTLWFKQHIAPPIILFESYFWKSTVTNVLVNSVVSNQSDPYVPQEALLLTIRQSALGIVAICFYLAVLLITFWHLARFLRAKFGESDRKITLLEEPVVSIGLFVVVWVIMPVILDTAGAFLQSTLVTPLMMAIIYRMYPAEGDKFAWFLYAAIVAIIVNNTNEIMKFQDALAKLH